eukprot:2724634-Rhodomonas_salina.3
MGHRVGRVPARGEGGLLLRLGQGQPGRSIRGGMYARQMRRASTEHNKKLAEGEEGNQAEGLEEVVLPEWEEAAHRLREAFRWGGVLHSGRGGLAAQLLRNGGVVSR